MASELSKVPTLDLNKFNNGNLDEQKKFVSEIGNSFNQIGFAIIKNHGLDSSLVSNLYDQIKKFFYLRDDIKKQYEIPEKNGQRGYVGKGKEHAKGSKVGDLKEFYHVGHPDSQGDYGENVWPKEFPLFEKFATKTYLELENIGLNVLKSIALYLNLDKKYFENKVRGGESIMRAIHYFPIHNLNIDKNAVRAGAHGDINFITILMGASAKGLEILTRNNKWIPIESEEDHLVINVGDMLERLTNNKLKSTIHRVVNPEKKLLHTSRFSIPFFLHPRPDMDLSCLENCIDKDNPKKYTDIDARGFLEERLQEIGLKSK